MTRKRKISAILAAALAAVLLYCSWGLAAPHLRSKLPADGFDLRISADKAVYSLGEYPRITATLTNKSGHTILLVPALDGSGSGRYPQVKFSVTPPENALPEEQLGRCGNTNPLLLTDFQIVPEHGVFNVCSEWGGPSRTEMDRGPGVYTVQLHYSTDETDSRRWLGGPLSSEQQTAALLKLGALLGKVPRIALTSNLLTLRFESPFTGPMDMLRRGDMAQARLALRMLDGNPAPADLPTVLTESIARLAQTPRSGDNRFLSAALGLFLKTAAPSDADRLWEAVSSSIDATEMGDSYWMDEDELRDPLLRALLLSPRDRDTRLPALFCVRQVTKNGSSSSRRPMYLTPELASIIVSEPGDDIGRALLAIYNDAIAHRNVDIRAFERVRDELHSRNLL